jgi:lipopolysaccharide transport system permease protein
MTDIPESAIETIIEPTRGWRFLAWKELYAYRDLFWLLVWRDIAARYKQTILGPLWYVIQPILTTVVFMVIFSRVARIPTNGVPSSLFYLCGLLLWNYFSQTFNSAAGTLVNNAGIFGKVYFPRLIVPLSAVASNLVGAAIQFALFAVVFALEKAGPRGASYGLTAAAWLMPLVFLQVALFSLGIGLWLSALTAKYRDFSVLSGFFVQLFMYASPVIYPLSRVPARWYLVAELNPMTFPLEALRHMLLRAGSPTASLGLVSLALTLLTLASGLLVFQKVEKNFVDVV